MELICAIDLLDGGAVRLVQGDYDRRVSADRDAPSLARHFVTAGCRRLHVIDLAGARAGRPVQLPLVAEVVAAARAVGPGVRVELGGGLRSQADVDAALDVVDDVLLGTAAIEDPAFLAAAAARHPGRVGVSLDLRGGVPALDGWLREGSGAAVAHARTLLDAGAARLVVTETSRDGTLAGPDLPALTALRAAFPEAVLVAAGGVGSLDDLRALRDLRLDGAVVGLALLTGAVDPAEALAVLA
ncbi:MAG TPA: HisA/HisF-related TIM barrel protein [Candidatus Limnocylindria bacterium]